MSIYNRKKESREVNCNFDSRTDLTVEKSTIVDQAIKTFIDLK